MKITCRFECKKRGIPVIMATDHGDSTIIDVERFDLEPERPIFHGRIHFTDKELRTINREQFVKLSTQIIDPSFFTERQQESILDVGKTLARIPRIGTAGALSGAALAVVTRRIANKEDMPSGRYVMGCEPALIPGYNSATQKKQRKEATKKFINTVLGGKKQ